MGRLGRWLKDLLICRRHCANNSTSSSSRHHNHSSITNDEAAAAAAAAGEEDSRESWRFACSRSSICRRYEQDDDDSTARMRLSFRAEEEDAAYDKEQREHAVAVAKATAAAADAAMVSARAAVALVRLTSCQGRTAATAAATPAGLEWRAAVKIQSAFRCHLAMKALRALRALVKMQAMVRGFLVRKQTALTFHSMQALMKAQATMHSMRSPDHGASLILQQNRPLPPPLSSSAAERKRILIARYEKQLLDDDDDNSFNEMMDSCTPPSISQVPSCLSAPRLLLRRTIQDHEDTFLADQLCQPVSTHNNSPRCLSSACDAPTRNAVSTKHLPMTKCPNYMVRTESFKAKLRCQSTPMQQAEEAGSPRVSASAISSGNVC